MSKNDVFLETKEFGNLYYKDTLLYYIYPRVFICKKNTSNELFLFYEMESGGSYDVWLMTGISNDEYWNLVGRRVPLQDIFKSKPEADLCTVKNVYGQDDDITTITRDGKKWLSELPEKPVYAEC